MRKGRLAMGKGNSVTTARMFDDDGRYSLYDGRPPASDGDTSRQAADSVSGHVSRLAGQVLAYVTRQQGATCYEVEQGLGLSHQTASARIRELVLLGKLTKTATRRKTGSGRSAAVWAATPPRAPER